MAELSVEQRLAELAAEVGELLRFEHEAGAFGVPAIAANAAHEPSRRSPGVDAPSSKTESAPRASTQGASSEHASSVASFAQLDALLAAARRAREQGATSSNSAAEVAVRLRSDAASVASSAGGTGMLAALADQAASCTRCRLHETRTRSVFARGAPTAEVVFVGEGPGFHEDRTGLPFVGPAGQLLDKMIAAMGFERDAVYVCNVVKCRPPDNRAPLPDEAAACAPFLDGQLDAVQPRVIVALGRSAAERLGCSEPGQPWRGVWYRYRQWPVMATYHPAYLLRNPEQKRPVWEDLRKVMARLAAKNEESA